MSGDNAPTAPTTPTAPTAPTAPAAPGGEFLHPHVIAPDVDNSEQPEEGNQPASVSPEQFQSLQDSFNTFREESQARETRLTETIQSLMMRPMTAAPTAPQAPAAPTGLDLSDLPDPVQNPKEYNTALAAKVNGYITESTHSQQQALMSQMTSAQALNGVYAKLQGQHPELAKRQILLQGAAAAEFGQLRAQGIDPLMIAQQNPDGLVANIVNRMNAELGVAPGQAPTAPTTPTSPGAARADSVAGGSQPAGPTAPTAPKTKSFTQQLKAAQQADGLI